MVPDGTTDSKQHPAVSQDRALQAADGMALQVGLLSRNDFNYDYRVSFRPEVLARAEAVYNYQQTDMPYPDREGVSVFARDSRGVFHTYSTYARGIDMLNTTYHYLELVPKGRDEGNAPQHWVRYHDRYSD